MRTFPPTSPTNESAQPPRPNRIGRRAVVGGIAVLAALAAFVVFWFEPHTLFIDDTVDEAFPTVEAGQRVDDEQESVALDVAELARGDFVSIDHTTSGTAFAVELADGRRVLRIEDLDSSNGPDLFAYLSAAPVGSDPGEYDDDFVNLGRLKGNIGNQNYDIPTDVDLSRYRSLVIWCDRFDVAFGAASLV